jgi:DNA topoisomerase-1
MDDSLEPEEAARHAGLRYVTDAATGISRRRAGRSFSYVAPDGNRITDQDEIARIKALAIPPAWTDVWISPSPHGHIQATGRDARGRKQYRYHPQWRVVRDENKYGRMLAFAEALPLIRERTERDLSVPGLPHERVLAAVVRLLDSTLIRVGNVAYARENNSFGLTTLRDRHVKIDGSTVRFRFRGKAGKEHQAQFSDRRLASVIKRCQDLPGQELFQYEDEEGDVRAIASDEVNEYLREVGGDDFTSKDFRTWGGTVYAAEVLQEVGEFGSETEARHNVVEAIKRVARQLGNTPAVCRTCYVHPAVIECYMDGTLLSAWERARRSVRGHANGLKEEEAILLRVLGRQAMIV